jgi:flagellar motility protein MotE (MotC chaperone)
MDHTEIERARDRHPAWRLLRADNAALILSFIGRFFVEENHGATPAGTLASMLDDQIYALNAADPERPRYPRPAADYLEDWAADGTGWLRRFYPTNSPSTAGTGNAAGRDEVHYDATPAFEKAYRWVRSLESRTFVGTESRLHTVVELLRQIVFGAETDPQIRLAELHRRRAAIDAEITEVSAGNLAVLDASALRDRYQQFAATARELLSDFREVEENFRALDRGARERIASWDGSKGDLLAELVGSRSDINGSDQGRSFQAFYDFLLSSTRQDELSDLLSRVQTMDDLAADSRLGSVHHDWSDAAERTQRTVRQISEQLRRFLDDQVWLENRRVLELVRAIEGSALACRDAPPSLGIDLDVPGVELTLPFERPLYDARPATKVESLLDPTADADVDPSALFGQVFVDQARLAGNIRKAVPPRSSALLTDIIEIFPVEHGNAEVVGYLALTDDDLEIAMDESEESVVDVVEDGRQRRIRMPRVTVTRR